MAPWVTCREVSRPRETTAINHAILGAGGVGGTLATVLAHEGEDVQLLVRESSQQTYPSRITLESVRFGDLAETIDVRAAPHHVDVLWITVKAPDLEDAVATIPPTSLDDSSLVIPLLNGIDHYERLQACFRERQVIAGTIRIEAERVAPGIFRQLSPFATIELAGGSAAGEQMDAVAAVLRKGGFTCEVGGQPLAILWRKLAFLAPVALTTTAAGATVGAVWKDPQWREALLGCLAEACAAAETDGVIIDQAAVTSTLDSAYPEMKSSMQKDFEAGRRIELDAIAGPILRRSQIHGLQADTTRRLVNMIDPGRA